MRFIKYHWFNIFIGIFIFVLISFTVLVALSPRYDRQKRGFIPCTEQLSDNISNCQQSFSCVISAVLKNSACDGKVIINGFSLWIKGEQSTPWSNYIFIPDVSEPEDNMSEEEKMFYEENPNYLEDFQTVKEAHKQLEESIANDQIKNK